jgi:thiol-disulfide isomerase/thioredoxin
MDTFSSSITPITNSSAFILNDLDLSNPVFYNEVNKYVILFKMDWCHYCQQYIPTYNKFANLIPNVQFLYVEGTTSPDILFGLSNVVFPEYTIKGYPTLIVFDNNGKFLKVVTDRFNLEKELN